MAFHIPEGRDGFYERVIHRFYGLIRGRVVDVVTETDVARWLTNFTTPEARYLAAHLLNAATVRTNKMNESGLQNIAEVIVPQLLKDANLWGYRSIEHFEETLGSRQVLASIRFMPVDGIKLDRVPGNSGDAIARRLRSAIRIGEGYMIRADDSAAWTRKRIGLTVFIDDLLGRGTQFCNFVARYGFNDYARENRCVYVPLLASRGGLNHVADTYPDISVHPVEILEQTAGFFTEDPDRAGIWIRDRANTCADVRMFYASLMQQARVGPEMIHGLELTLLLPDRSPNNALKAIWSEDGRWQPLKRR